MTALKEVVEDNEQPVIGQSYSADAEDGMLVVVIPDEDKETELEFKYW